MPGTVLNARYTVGVITNRVPVPMEFNQVEGFSCSSNDHLKGKISNCDKPLEKRSQVI